MKGKRFLLGFLLVAVVLLTGVTVVQNRVIARQSREITWLLTHCK